MPHKLYEYGDILLYFSADKVSHEQSRICPWERRNVKHVYTTGLGVKLLTIPWEATVNSELLASPLLLLTFANSYITLLPLKLNVAE